MFLMSHYFGRVAQLRRNRSRIARDKHADASKMKKPRLRHRGLSMSSAL